MSENQKALSAEQSLPPRTELSAHTPGPWTFGSHCIINEVNGKVVAHTIQMMTFADARLIAAAPQMLDALERLLERAHEFPPNIVSYARAAVRNATGAP
jgi:hypothetical protein